MDNNHNNYNYIFWNNTYENVWYAIPTNQHMNFFSGNRKKAIGVLSAPKIETLLTKIKNQK
jgi:hypothetical protein